MAKKANLTPQRRQELKDEILEALDNKQNNQIKSITKAKNILKNDLSITDQRPKNFSLNKSKQKISQSLINDKKNLSEIKKFKEEPQGANKKISNSKLKINDNDTATNKNQNNRILKSNLSVKKLIINKDDKNDSLDVFSQLAEKKKQQEKQAKNRWLYLLISSLSFLFLIIAFDILGIYKFNFRDPLSYEVIKIFNLPAGVVNGKKILLSDYYDDLKFLSSALAKKREGLQDLSVFNDLSDKVFYRQVANILVRQKLLNYQKSVSESFLNNQINLLINQSGSVKQAEATIKSIYGLNLSQFKEMILRPLIEKQFLQEAIVNDNSLEINKKAKERAEMILKMALTEGVDFNALASQYTEDEIGVNTGGDFGWVIKEQLDPTWREEVFALQEGQVLPKVIKNKFGYHIIKLEKKVANPDTGKDSVKLRHILIKVDVDQYIKELMDQAVIKKYIK